MTPGNPWAAILSEHRDRAAFIDETGHATSYRALREDADVFLGELGPDRQLVFLEAENSAASIGAYVGCLLGGHAVYLFHKQDSAAFDALVRRYRPNAIVTLRDRERIIERHSSEPPALHPELSLLLSTSGSTGSPKFVKLSQNNVVSNAKAIAEYLGIGPADRAITSLRFNYSYGISVVNSHLVMGASLLLTSRSVTDGQFWDLFRTFSVTSFAGVPYTYETLARMDSVLANVPSLRYATQAGGRLQPDLVRHFARLGKAMGWRFYVMYGQTEAAPRIAYLPPEMAEAYPDAIGKAIPGGRIEILGANGDAVVQSGQPGELAYSGPNVMLGYAESREQLATEESPPRLLTGDIAEWNDAGLVRIVGRTARFVKPFGMRVNLDEIEGHLRALAPGAVCAGTDDIVAIARPRSGGAPASDIVSSLSARYRLPAFVFRVVDLEEIPRFANGKIAYRDIVALAENQTASPTRTRSGLTSWETEFLLARNQVITLLISGLWHGAAWTFVTWGAFHGLMLVLQRQVQRFVRWTGLRLSTLNTATIVAQIAIVFALVAVSRVFFRANSLSDARIVFSNIVNGPYDWGGIDGKSTLAVGVAIIATVMTAEAAVEAGIARRIFARRRILRTAFAIGAFLTTLLIGEFTGGRFIYVRF